uniref:Transmembrane protein n=1 Tax=Kalanchoe fedtschenkoi TaxID=63787 RepID=A0A7N0UGB8_KALFE
MQENLTAAELEFIRQDLNSTTKGDHGWQTVTYPKKQRKIAAPKSANSDKSGANRTLVGGDESLNVFRSLEEQSEERRRRVLEAQKEAIVTAASNAAARSNRRSDSEGDEDSEDDNGKGVGNGDVETKKVKVKKEKKPKVTVAEAAAKIDASELSAFLVDVTGSFENQDEIQMKRLADYFGRAFAGVSSAQFPWVKMFRESSVAKIVDIPLNQVSDAVQKTAADWINKRSLEALSSFALWLLDSILADLATHQPAAKGTKKVVQQPSSKSQVAIFLVLAMVLRRKPDVLIAILPTLRDNSKYQGQDKLPVIIWMVAQASIGDLCVGLFAWAHNLLPIVGNKSCNPQSRDIILQSVERIISGPKARAILVNGAVRKGERLVPPASLDTLMRLTFPAASARVKATERFEAVYPTLKDVALAGAPGSKSMKQVSQQIFGYAIKAAVGDNPQLVLEATNVSIWCLTQHPDCYKLWEKIYEENLEASVAILRELGVVWREFSGKLSSLEPLKETIRSFKHLNETALAKEEDLAHQALYKEADKCCKVILGRTSHGGGSCLKSTVVVVVVVLALAAGTVLLSPPNVESWDWNKLVMMFNPRHSKV